MIILWKYTLEEVLPFVSANYKKEKKLFWTFLVKVSSQRLLCFKNSTFCIVCNRVWSHFRLEQSISWETPHLNLYSDDNILMTKDHIVPKSKWWENKMYNYQTMCTICNCKKGNTRCS